MGGIDVEDLKRDFFISQIMVGNCPKCNSGNTHDCEALFFSISEAKELEKMGSKCGIAREIDDNTIGHCDTCDYIWCLECGSPISIENPLCGHWKVCGDCSEENDYLDFDEKEEKVCPKCEYWLEGCTLEDPLECPENECPYEPVLIECPKIRDFAASQNINI